MNINIFVISIIFYIIEILMAVFYFGKIWRFRRITLKDTVIYPGVIVLTSLTLLMAYTTYMGKDFMNALPPALAGAAGIVTFKLDEEVFKAMTANKEDISAFLLLGTYLLEFLISTLTLTSIIILFFFINLKNKLRGVKSLFSRNRETCYVLGFNEGTKVFIKDFHDKYLDNSKKEQNKIKKNIKLYVILDSSVLNDYKEERVFLDKNKIPYIYMPYQTKKEMEKTIERYRQKNHSKGKVWFVTFFDSIQQNDLWMETILSIIDDLKETHFSLVVDYDQELFMEGRLKNKKLPRVKVFNRHTLISYDFMKNYVFSKYIPADYLNEDLTVKDIDINLHVIGFGKVNQSVLRDALIVNQFVSKEGDVLKPKYINVDVYEIKDRIEGFEIFNGLLRYQKDLYQNSQDYFELPEDYNSHITFHKDISLFEHDTILDIAKAAREKASKKPQLNFFLISLDSDFININVARSLKKSFDYLEGSHNIYFVRVKEKMYELDNSLIPYGNDSQSITYDNVVASHLFDASIEFKNAYDQVNNDVTTLDQDSLKSNFYAVCGLYFKFALLAKAKDIIQKDNVAPRSLDEMIKEYVSRIPKEKKNYHFNHIMVSPEVEFYDSLCLGKDKADIRDLLAFIEHTRWNAYSMSNGTLPLSKQECEKLLEEQCQKIKNHTATLPCINGEYDVKFNRTANSFYHLCLTTQKGLKAIYIWMSNLMCQYEEKYKDDQISFSTNPDFVSYDYAYFDMIATKIFNNDTAKLKTLIQELYDSVQDNSKGEINL